MIINTNISSESKSALFDSIVVVIYVGAHNRLPSTTPRGRAARIAFQARAISHQSEIIALRA